MEQEKPSKEDNQQNSDDIDKEKELKPVKTEENDSTTEPVKSEESKATENVAESTATVKTEKKEEKENSNPVPIKNSTPSTEEQSIASKTIDSSKPDAHESPGTNLNVITSNSIEPEGEQSEKNSTEATAVPNSTKPEEKSDSNSVEEKCDVAENSDVTSTSSCSSFTATPSTSSGQRSSNGSSATARNSNKKYSSYKDIGEEDLDGDSLMTKVILFQLQNKLTVDNSRLDMAKNKYLMTNENNNSSNSNLNFASNNSNSSDSNMSSGRLNANENSEPQQEKDTKQSSNEFKGGGAEPGVSTSTAISNESSLLNNNTASDNNDKSNPKDSESISNGADRNNLVSENVAVVSTSSSTSLSTTSSGSNAIPTEKTNNNNVINLESKQPPVADSIEANSNTLVVVAESVVSTKVETVEAQKQSPENSGLSNDNLDFRETASKPAATEEPAMLDLTVPSRDKMYDDKCVPPIKRKNALYQCMPDFSKPIFTAPTITKTTTSVTDQSINNKTDTVPPAVPKMKTLDFGNVARATSELQMSKPDFSNCFSKDSKTDDRSAAKIPVNESDLAELRRKNNYVSDLQLKPPSTAQPASAPSTSYKIDYRPITQGFGPGDNREPQNYFEEPTAHIIHKQKFLPHSVPEKIDSHAPNQKAAIWTPHLLGGCSQSVEYTKPKIVNPGLPYENSLPNNQREGSAGSNRYTAPVPSYAAGAHPYPPENRTATVQQQRNYVEEAAPSSLPQQHTAQTTGQYPTQSSHEESRKYNPPHLPFMGKDKQYIRASEAQERQKQETSFSLKQKEHQLRQEGTIITVKKDAPHPTATQSIPNSDYPRTSDHVPRQPKEPPDLYRDYKLKQGSHEFVPSSKDLSASSKIQHTSTASSNNNLRRGSETSASASAPYSHLNNEYSHNLYPHQQAPRQQDYRYDPLKSSGAFKPIEHNKSPVSAMYPPSNDSRQIRHIGNTSVSPVMQAHHMLPNETHASSSSSRNSYGSPSPIHHQQSHIQSHGRSPIPQQPVIQKHDGQMNPPLNWPHHLQSGRPNVGSPIDRQNQSNLMTSPSPTNVLHPSPKPSLSPIQSPVHMKPATSPHTIPNHYQIPQNHQKYPNNYPGKIENKELYYKSQAANPAANHMMGYPPPQRYPESRSIGYESFSRQFEVDNRKYSNSDVSKYPNNHEVARSHENLNRLKEVSARYSSPVGDYSGMRSSSSEASLNQPPQRYNQYPEQEMRKSGSDIREPRDPYRHPEPTRTRSLEPNSYPENSYRQNVPSSHQRTIDQRMIPSTSSSNLKNLNALEIRPVDPQRSYSGHASTSSNYDRRSASDLATISKVEPKPVSVERIVVPPPTRENQTSIIKTPISVLGPVKRESPLDLSVKTIKTKADSTGCDDYAVAALRGRTDHKVEFMPNFNQAPERREYSNSRHPHPAGPSQNLQPPQQPQSYNVPNNTSHRIQNIVNHERPNVVQTHHSNSIAHAAPRPNDIQMENSRREEYYRSMPSTSQAERGHSAGYPSKDGYPPRNAMYDFVPDNRMRPNAPIPSQSVQSRDKPYQHEIMNHHAPAPADYRPGPAVHYQDQAKAMQSYKPNAVGDPQQQPHHPLPYNANIPPNLDIKKAPHPKYDLESERKHDRSLVENILYKRKVATAPQASYPPGMSPNNYDANRKRSSESVPSHMPVPPKLTKMEDGTKYENPPYPSHYIAAGPDPRGPFDHQRPPVQHHPQNQYPVHPDFQNTRTPANYPPAQKGLPENKQYPDHRYPVKDPNLVRPHVNTPPSSRDFPAGAQQPYAFGGPQYYPNPKAEMLRREDPSNLSYKSLNNLPRHPSPQATIAMPDKLPYPQQNFYPRPDDVHLKRDYVPPPPLAAHANKSNYPPQKPTKPQTLTSENVIKIDQISGQVNNEQKCSTNLTGSANMGSNGNIARGADQNTISKLQNILNMKEKQKLKIQQSIEISEDENNKMSDTSPRPFRTKGELKGYNPIPAVAPLDSQKPIPSVLVDNRRKVDEPINLHKEIPVNRVNEELSAAFDVMDWGSACNDFVEQLQTGKKRGKRKRVGKNANDNEFKIEVVDKPVSLSDLPGVNADISEVPIEFVKSMNSKDVKETCSSEEMPLERYRNASSNNNSQDSTSSRSVRDIRIKQRKAHERSRMAKLGDPSSSENETDVKRVSRNKIKVPRLRTRSSLRMPDHSDSSLDEVSDEDAKNKPLNMKRKKQDMETSESEPINVRKKINKAISKLEELTSSESENKKSAPKSVDNSKNSEKKATAPVDQSKKSKDDQDPKAATNKSNKTTNKKPAKTESTTNKTPKENSSSSDSEESDEGQKSSKQDKKSKTTTTPKSSAKKSKTVEEESTDDDKSKNTRKKEEVTMTRSKSKLEIEKKLSNSKVLRNEKIVQNISPDRKAKHGAEMSAPKKTPVTPTTQSKKKEKGDDVKRKILDTESDESGKQKSKSRKVSKLTSSSDEESEQETVAERLRPRKCKTEAAENISSKNKDKKDKDKDKDDKKEKDVKEGNEKKGKTQTPSKSRENEGASTSQPSLPCKIPLFPFFREDKATKFTPGWETETYNYKKSLKVPLRLITIGRPPLHGVSHSLPDLDHQSSDASDTFFESRRKVLEMEEWKKRSKNPQSKKDDPKTTSGRSSIVDILHQRMLINRKLKPKKFVPSKLAKSTTDKSNEPESQEMVKKNIFETCILKSRTRTESKTQKSKESLREVFGGDDARPSSAPPFIVDEDLERIQFAQRMRQLDLELVRGELDKVNQSQAKTEISKQIKIEKIDEDSNLNPEDEDDDDNETVQSTITDIKEEPSERDLVTPTPILSKVKKNRRGIRSGRRKGSSGFDYIRKKKKPTPHNNSENQSAGNVIRKRMAAMENLQEKDENDIGKEIKGWVLNKGVGESVMHKAARLGYIDVIVYCLDRLEMGPDPKDNAGYTPLHEACSKGHLDIARLLLQFGANHSETAHSGIRPLHEAVEGGNIEIVRLLLAYGADPCLSTYSGQTPIMLAENDEMIGFLKSYLSDLENSPVNRSYWRFEGAWQDYDTDDYGYDIFGEVPLELPESNVSSMISTFSTSTTSLITATTQMSDNETVTSETVTPIKAPTPISKNMDIKFSIPLTNSNEIGLNLSASTKFPQKMKKCDTNSNNIVMTNKLTDKDTKCDKLNNNEGNINHNNGSKGKKLKSCTVVLNHIDSAANRKNKKSPPIIKQESITEISSIDGSQKLDKEDFDDPEIEHLDESDGELFEFEESDSPLPPLYLLKDEGSEKWILLSDLCNLLKVKSKDAVLKQICPSSPPNSVKKEILREFEMTEFLKKAICLQLFCAGEKLNPRSSSKVILVRYTDSVRNLLGVQTFMMNI